MKTQFYKPQQGDTAAAVADGYDGNFQALDQAKADAAATASALAEKVDKADGAGLMTDAERDKLEGIEAGANAYTHPESHPADMITDAGEKVIMTTAEREKLAGIEVGANAYALPAATAVALGGVKAGDNVTIAEDGTLSATAAPYELPVASVTTLGGVKVGNNLTMREDGTLDAPGGGSVIVSPDAGNTIEARDNGLYVPESSGGGDMSELEIGIQNLVPVSSLFTRELSDAAELQGILPILANPVVMGDGTNRAFAMASIPFTGRYLTVDQPIIGIAPGWQIVAFGVNPITSEVFDTFTMNGSAWPEAYPKTYDLGTDQILMTGFIIRKTDNSAFELSEVQANMFVVCRGNKTIGFAEPYAAQSDAPPKLVTGILRYRVQEGKFVSASSDDFGKFTITTQSVIEDGAAIEVYGAINHKALYGTFTILSTNDVTAEATYGSKYNPAYASSYGVYLKLKRVLLSEEILVWYSYWIPGA